jgi:hypothetical protein
MTTVPLDLPAPFAVTYAPSTARWFWHCRADHAPPTVGHAPTHDAAMGAAQGHAESGLHTDLDPKENS